MNYLITKSLKCHRELWRSIIYQAVLDVTSKNEKIKMDAIEWLKSEDFQLTCDYSDYEPDYILGLFRRVLQDGNKTIRYEE